MLNAKLRYAIMAMVDLALQKDGKNIRAIDIAKRQNIPEKVLELILPKLKNSNLLIASIGPGGGYKLAKKPESILLRQIIDVVDQQLKATRCPNLENKQNGCLKEGKKCKTHDLWHLLERKFYNFLEDITLADIIAENLTCKKNTVKNVTYLDHNSTTNIISYAHKKFVDNLDGPYNASSSHYNGQIARKIIEEARQNIKNNLHAGKDYELIFTSCGTESNNLVFHSFENYTHIISSIEHISVTNSANDPIKIRVNSEGDIDLSYLQQILSQADGKKLVSIMSANNETGVMQPIKEIAEICHKHNALFHTDAAQSISKVKFNIEELNADFVTFSSHKIGGGFGAAALIYKKNLQIKPLIKGGGQEMGLRAGTENLPAIAAFSGASSFIENSIKNMERVLQLRDYLEEQVQQKIPEAIVCSKNAKRLSNTSCIIIPGFSNSLQLMHFDLNNICVSSGAACSSGKIETSHVLLNMGYTRELADCAIRISLNIETTKKNINDLVESWVMLYNNL